MKPVLGLFCKYTTLKGHIKTENILRIEHNPLPLNRKSVKEKIFSNGNNYTLKSR
jgi:hypothetical protein